MSTRTEAKRKSCENEDADTGKRLRQQEREDPDNCVEELRLLRFERVCDLLRQEMLPLTDMGEQRQFVRWLLRTGKHCDGPLYLKACLDTIYSELPSVQDQDNDQDNKHKNEVAQLCWALNRVCKITGKKLERVIDTKDNDRRWRADCIIELIDRIMFTFASMHTNNATWLPEIWWHFWGENGVDPSYHPSCQCAACAPVAQLQVWKLLSPLLSEEKQVEAFEYAVVAYREFPEVEFTGVRLIYSDHDGDTHVKLVSFAESPEELLPWTARDAFVYLHILQHMPVDAFSVYHAHVKSLPSDKYDAALLVCYIRFIFDSHATTPALLPRKYRGAIKSVRDEDESRMHIPSLRFL
jgi:hypothetical protein